MKRILLTGASGFIGQNAIPELLARGFEIHALGRTRPSSEDVIFHQVDLLDPSGVAQLVNAICASHLMHLAWCAEPGLFWRSPTNLDWTAASLQLFRSFLNAGGTRAIGAGSCAEYSWGPPRLSENMPCDPATLYGVAKDATRRVLTSFAKEHGLSFAWGRLFFLYGPGERSGRLVSAAIRALKAKKRFPTSNGLQRRDFSHVADVAAACVALVDSTYTGPINIGSGEAVPVRHILERIGKLVGRLDLIDFGVRTLAPKEPDSIEADISKLRSSLEFTPLYNLEMGLLHTVESMTDKS